MGGRKINIRESVTESIAEVAWFIESKGLPDTAENFSDSVYDFINTLADDMVTHAPCRDTERQFIGFKCKNFGKKYTVVFMETNQEITVHEFLPSKMIHW